MSFAQTSTCCHKNLSTRSEANFQWQHSVRQHSGSFLQPNFLSQNVSIVIWKVFIFDAALFLSTRFGAEKHVQHCFFAKKKQISLFWFLRRERSESKFCKGKFSQNIHFKATYSVCTQTANTLRVEILLYSASRFNVGSFFFRTSLLEALSWKNWKPSRKFSGIFLPSGWVVGCKHLKNICNNISLL